MASEIPRKFPDAWVDELPCLVAVDAVDTLNTKRAFTSVFPASPVKESRWQPRTASRGKQKK